MRSAVYITLLLTFTVQLAEASPIILAAPTPTFLPVGEAFQLTASWKDDGIVSLRWFMLPGYYLYRDSLQFSVNGRSVEGVSVPSGNLKEDEYFGKVQVFYGELKVDLPATGRDDPVALEVGYQGCAEAGYCYPPQKQILTP